jgi:hypothetical protein
MVVRGADVSLVGSIVSIHVPTAATPPFPTIKSVSDQNWHGWSYQYDGPVRPVLVVFFQNANFTLPSCSSC